MPTNRGIIGCVVLVVAGIVAAGAGIRAQTQAQQPEMKTLKADFVPGEKTLFFDDFTDMNPGDAPAHFKARGAAPELMAGGGIRELNFAKAGVLTANLTAFPKNFTIETEVAYKVPVGNAQLFLVLMSKAKEVLVWYAGVYGKNLDVTVQKKVPTYEELGRSRTTPSLRDPLRLALWVQNGRLRAFVNGDKVVDANQVDLPPIDQVEIRPNPTGAGVSIGLRSVRIAESTPDFSQVIGASGRYVSHGILFDTDSDRLKPESAAVIQSIAKGLEANPALKLLIEGHTDSVGDAAHNLDLSKRRAEAVKAVLVSQFGIDASRLTTAGLGATKPMDSNDTPQGRSQNRRVEFVKQ